MSESTRSVLFVCVHNAGRSQMAAALPTIERLVRGLLVELGMETA